MCPACTAFAQPTLAPQRLNGLLPQDCFPLRELLGSAALLKTQDLVRQALFCGKDARYIVSCCCCVGDVVLLRGVAQDCAVRGFPRFLFVQGAAASWGKQGVVPELQRCSDVAAGTDSQGCQLQLS